MTLINGTACPGQLRSELFKPYPKPILVRSQKKLKLPHRARATNRGDFWPLHD
jgi:hypothetical protein